MKHPILTIPNVSRETEDRLRIYAATLMRWNPTINLVSKSDIGDLWSRHILDSLHLHTLLPPEFSHAIDLGSGGGLPAIVLAIASGRPFHLVESDARKAAFLREVARETAAPATIHCARIETLSLPAAPVITARALAPLPRLLSYAAPFLAPNGIFLFPKGRNAALELTEAAAEWHMGVECFTSAIDPAATILKLSEVVRRSAGS